MLNILGHKGNANLKSQQISLHIHQDSNDPEKKRKMLIIGKDVEKLEPLYTAEGNVKWCCTLENSLAAPLKARYKLTV